MGRGQTSGGRQAMRIKRSREDNGTIEYSFISWAYDPVYTVEFNIGASVEK
jgi:hypothetical protein